MIHRLFKQSLVLDHKILYQALKEGLQPDTQNRGGDSLLHQAVIQDKLESVKVLLEFNAPICKKNAKGFTPLQLAQYLNRKNVLGLLKADESNPFPHLKIPNFEYISHLVFRHIRFFKRVVRHVASYPLDNKISVERKWLGAFYRPCIESTTSPPFNIRFINSRIGYGLFAAKTFKKEDFLGEYTGEVKRAIFLSDLRGEYVGEYALGGYDPVRFVIDAKRMGNYTRFINHHDDPNASAITVIAAGLLHVIFKAERKIEIGEEITFDYGPYYWKKRKKLPESERDFFRKNL